MIGSTTLHTTLDGFFSHFRTGVGILRAIRRDIREEIRLNEKLNERQREYAEGVKLQDLDKVEKALAENGHGLKKGYFLLVREQMNRIFDALHKALQEDKKMLDWIQDLERHVERDPILQDQTREVIKHTLNQCTDIINKVANEIIRDIEGMESLTINRIKLLHERESQMRQIIGDVLKERGPFRAAKKATNIAEKELEMLEHPTADQLSTIKMFDSEHNQKGITAQITLAVQEMIVIIDEVVVLLTEIHHDFLNAWNSERGNGLRLAETTSDNAPSLTELRRPVAQGGGGIDATIFKEINDIAKATEQEFKQKRGILEGEARRYLSVGERLKQ